MADLQPTKPVVNAAAWGVGIATLGAIGLEVLGPVLAECPSLKTQWPMLLFAGISAAVMKYLHSGRSAPLSLVLEVVRRLVARESPNAAAVVTQAATEHEVKAEVAKATKLTVTAFLIALPMAAMAASRGQTISVTDTSQTITFPAKNSISLYNCSNGSTPTCAGDSAYFIAWTCSEQQAGSIVAATTATPSTPLALGESVQLTTVDSVGGPWCAVTIVADTGDTASVRLIAE